MSKKILIGGVLAAVLLVVVAAFVWYRFRHDVAQPQWITSDARNKFMYGSVGAEQAAGIPYWVWLALPRMFPEYLPGPGGYAALGFPWEEGREMPIGFSKKIVGYVRVAGNCATCHAASYRRTAEDVPTVTASRPAHGEPADRLLTFLSQCAKDPRFNAGDILSEISMATKLSVFDRLMYRFVLIPGTRKAILRGRPIFVDATLAEHCRNPRAPTQFPRDEENAQAARLEQSKFPAYPLPVKSALASSGAAIFRQQCDSCHGSKAQGGSSGAAASLAGLWLRAPYLHNGSVPTVRALLSPIDQRPRTFYRGNDLLDTRDVGFVSTEASDMGRQFQLYDTGAAGHANGGHAYGIRLSDSEKDCLLEYLKTL